MAYSYRERADTIAMKGKDSTYRPPAGTVCLVSGPHADGFEVTTIHWATDILVLYGQPGLWPILTQWDLILCKPLEETLPPIKPLEETLPPLKFGYFTSEPFSGVCTLYFGNPSDRVSAEIVSKVYLAQLNGASLSEYCEILNKEFQKCFKHECCDIYIAMVTKQISSQLNNWFDERDSSSMILKIATSDGFNISYALELDSITLKVILEISRLRAERAAITKGLIIGCSTSK